MRLCSACLLGINCRYNNEIKSNKKVLELATKEILIPVCPEQLGGLPTPRKPAVKQGNKVITDNGDDVTENFIRGAEETLKIAKLYNIKSAILKQRSPSCWCGKIYDENFLNIIDGDWIATKLLKENGIEVISEEDL